MRPSFPTWLAANVVLFWAISTFIVRAAAPAKTNTVATPQTNVVATTEIAGQSESTLSSVRAVESESSSDPGVSAVQ